MAAKTDFGLPVRVFLYTLDQIATMLAMEVDHLKRKLVFFDGRSVGAVRHDQLIARNIGLLGEKPEWRVSEEEFKRWLRRNGFRVYDKSSVR